MATKQGSIAGFFAKKPTATQIKSDLKAIGTKTQNAGKAEVKDGIIDLTEDGEREQGGISVDAVGKIEAPDQPLGGLSSSIPIKTDREGILDSPRKRRKLSPQLQDQSTIRPRTELAKVETKPKSDYLTINPSEPFTYPPLSHPSYAPPPSPTHNHPFPIPPPSSHLLSSLQFNPNPRPILKPKLDLDLLYFNQFISGGSKGLYGYLLDSLPWYRVTYVTKGITINTPRWTTVFGKDCSSREWSGYAVKPRAIPEILLRLMEIVEKVTGETYNFTLVNYYASGTDSISYHSDSESFLGPEPCIASLSLGSSRDFLLRHTAHKSNGAPTEKFSLQDGDMVVMRRGTQANWMHSIPKRMGKGVGGRINITFRKGVVKYATKNYLDYNVGKGAMYRWKGGEMVEQKGA